MNNYEFCVHWVLAQIQRSNARVLDYGCGAGQIVRELKARNIDAFGCDVFYEGGDYSNLIAGDLLGNVIKRMEDGRIPFGDRVFDLIVTNQVMEHVQDLDGVLREIHRVLKPGGKVLSIFPDKSVWREGHCGIPFLHWFPIGSRLRVYYAASFRWLGFGYHKGSKGAMRWSEDFCEWLDRWTWYREREDVEHAYGRYFVDMHDIGDLWLIQRLGARATIGKWVPVAMRRLVVRTLGGLVFVCSKKTA